MYPDSKTAPIFSDYSFFSFSDASMFSDISALQRFEPTVHRRQRRDTADRASLIGDSLIHHLRYFGCMNFGVFRIQRYCVEPLREWGSGLMQWILTKKDQKKRFLFVVLPLPNFFMYRDEWGFLHLHYGTYL